MEPTPEQLGADYRMSVRASNLLESINVVRLDERTKRIYSRLQLGEVQMILSAHASISQLLPMPLTSHLHRFLSTSRIESLDQKLIAITRLTTNSALLRSLALLLSLGISNRLFNDLSWNRRLNCFKQVTTLYIRRHQREILEMHYT